MDEPFYLDHGAVVCHNNTMKKFKIRLPLSWVIGKGTKRHKDKSKYKRHAKHKKRIKND